MAGKKSPPADYQVFPQKCPIVGVTGEVGSGKTRFILGLCNPKHLLLFDQEKSSETYWDADNFNFTRVDVAEEMMKLGLRWSDRAARWVTFSNMLLERVKTRAFKVVGVDPVAEIEEGLVEYIKAHPDKFGLTPKQISHAPALLWGAMKSEWKSLLLEASTYCEVFAFSAHLGEIFADNKPTGRKKPQGKDVLMKLASLYLWMERKPDPKTRRVPDVPSAIVLKERLGKIRWDEKKGETVQLPGLPPRLPVATRKAICDFMLSPPDWSKLPKDMLAPEANPDDDKMLDLALSESRRETEQAKADAARAEMELIDKRERYRQENAAAAAPTKTPPPPAGEEEMEVPASRRKQQQAEMTHELEAAVGDLGVGDDEPCTKHDVERIDVLFNELAISDDGRKKSLAKRGVEDVYDLTHGQASELIAALCARLDGAPKK